MRRCLDFGKLLCGLNTPLTIALAMTAIVGTAQAGTVTPEQTEFFEKRVRPLLIARCYACHSAKSAQSGLRLDSRAALLAGGARGPAIIIGQPDKSLLLTAVGYADGKLQMPPQGKLKPEEIATLTEWVGKDAFWPGAPDKAVAVPIKSAFDIKARAKHWSFQPLHRSAVPQVKEKSWPRNPIDNFVLAKLEAAGIAPAKPADRRTLIRRVTYDLIGLPPTPEEVEAFVQDKSPQAYEKVVDRLLASPHYGERWARHWLDLARYAETNGHEFDFEKPGAYEYRDYVIRAFNTDLPYDQFVKEQIAGDLLRCPRRNPLGHYNESALGTAFYFLGEGTHSPVDLREDEASHIDNQIDVVSKTFLGLSVGCARCHDHKFDPISAKDYYALSGYMKSSRYDLVNMTEPDKNSPILSSLDQISSQLDTLTVDETPAVKPFRLQPGQVQFADFSGSSWKDWTTTGYAFGPGPRPHGLPAHEQPAGNPQLTSPLTSLGGPGVADSGYLSGRLCGTLRSPTFTISKPFVFYHLAGQNVEVNLIVDNFQLIMNPIYGGLKIIPNDPNRMQWYGQDVSKWVGHRAYIEFVDRSDGRLIADSVVFSDHGAPPVDVAPAPHARTVALESDKRAAIAALLERRRALEATLPAPHWAMAAADGTGENDRVHIRGNVATLGVEAPRRFLEACGGATQPAARQGSDRLELAERMVAATNPLLPRVMVNRLWQHHFGEGIVRSPDDFGVMGQPPSHPELLDWLATEFVRQGWSIKKMHRMMLLSSAYRMSSIGDMKADHADPTNRLVHRMNARRLEAEAIRDGILAVSGRLDRTLYGPSVPPYLTSFMNGRGRPGASGPLDGAGRRSIYMAIRRNFLPPFFLAFDFPVPFTSMGRRTVSNVPAQALALMNNPFVVEQAGVWAKRVLAQPNLTQEQRIGKMVYTAFGRPATSQEISAMQTFLAEQDRQYGGADAPASWKDLCHVLFNLKEFIFIN